jgi:hypothetical protein
MNKMAYHLWSLSRDENLLRRALIVCIALAVGSYLLAGMQAVPSADGGFYQGIRLTPDSRLTP